MSHLKLLITQRYTDYSRFRQETFIVEAKAHPPYALPCKQQLEVKISDLDMMTTRNLGELVCKSAIEDLPEDFFPAWSPV